VTLTTPPFRKTSGVMSGLSMEKCLSNLKPVALTALELSLTGPLAHTRTHTERKQYLRHSLRSLGGDNKGKKLYYASVAPEKAFELSTELTRWALMKVGVDCAVVSEHSHGDV